MTRTAPHVDAAYYGRGVLVPVVVIDPRRCWSRTLPGELPHRGADGCDLLAVRWCGPQDDEPAAPGLLLAAARRAPAAPASAAELARFRNALPDHLYLIALPATAEIGTWAERPGRAAVSTCTVPPTAA